MPVDAIEDHLRDGWVVCTARVSGAAAKTPRGRVLDRIEVFHGEVPPRFEILYDWFEPSKPESAHNVPLALGRDHLFCLRRDEAMPERFALAGTSWLRNQPVEYFERSYPEFLASIPVVVRTERLTDPAAKLAAQARLLEAGDELAGYAARALMARWNEAVLPRDRLVLAEIEERVLAFCGSSSRDWRIRHYALGKVAGARHEGGVWASSFPELLAELAGRETEPALRWRAAATLRWLAGDRRVEPRGGWLALVDACVASLVRERVEQVEEELARAIAAMGPAEDLALAPLDRAGPEKRFFAAAVRDHWMRPDRSHLDPERFRLRR